MKKLLKILGIIVGLVVGWNVILLIIGLTLPDEEVSEETAAVETAAQTAVSEWTEYGSLADAEAASGITYSFGDVIDCGVYYAKQYMAKDGMMEVTYYDETGVDTYVIRQANLTDADISEDVTEYSHDFLEDDCGVTGIRLRGTQDQLAVCSFNYGNYSYVIYPGAMCYADTFFIIAEMTGVDTTLYAHAYDTDDPAPAPDTDAYDEWLAASAEFDDEYYEANDYGWGDLDDEDLEANDYGWGDLDDEDLEANDYGWGEDEYNEWSDPGDTWDYEDDGEYYEDNDYDF